MGKSTFGLGAFLLGGGLIWLISGSWVLGVIIGTILGLGGVTVASRKR